MQLRFNRRELAGSLGDLGTLLPLAFGVIVVCGVDPTASFLGIGLYYILSGLYFGITVPVQPMKVISAYAIAGALSAEQIAVSGMWIGGLLLIMALTGTIDLVSRLVPKSTVRGVQLVTGVVLLVQGIKFMLGQTSVQAAQGSAEPFLAITSFGPVPVGIVLGLLAVVIIMLLLDNRTAPAGLVAVVGGALAGLALGGWRGLEEMELGLNLPQFMDSGLPSSSILVLALTALALPQLPMTIGNAVMAQADLTREYFSPEEAKRSTPRALAMSMGLFNVVAALFGAMPLCHGSGGLAAHYRFGARTAGSNLMIGGFFLLVGLLLGNTSVALFGLIPFSVLGALLCFAGAQLAMMILDIKERSDMFVVITMLAVSLVSNLGVGFGVGIALAYMFKYSKIRI